MSLVDAAVEVAVLVLALIELLRFTQWVRVAAGRAHRRRRFADQQQHETEQLIDALSRSVKHSLHLAAQRNGVADANA